MTLGIAWILSALMYGWEEDDCYRTWSQQAKDGVSSMDFVARSRKRVRRPHLQHRSWSRGRSGNSHPAQWWAALEKHMSPKGPTVVLPPWPGLY